jgi:hypothetical protein
MPCLLGKPITKQHVSLSVQLETIQEDILRLSRFVAQLSGLSDEVLAVFEISDQLQTIHHCLKRFEAHCLAIQVAPFENEFADPFIDESCETIAFPDHDWGDIRKDAKRANKLANQLTLTLTKIRSGLGGSQAHAHVPEEILQINQVVGNAVSALASDWNNNPA